MTNEVQIYSVIIFGVVYLSQSRNVYGLDCGRINISRPLILDGKQVVRGEWPFIAALYNVHESKFFCSGTLITNQHVLTGNNFDCCLDAEPNKVN